MNRKLRHSLSGLAASGAAFAMALMVAVPAGPSPVLEVVAAPVTVAATPDARTPISAAVARSAELAAAASARALEASELVQPSSRSGATRKGARHRRQTLVMPYFSLSPRG